jgi:hypothetical protein
MIQVKITKLEEELKVLENAITDFKPYSEGFTKSCLSDLEGLNSDFIEAVKETLMSMADTKAPKLIEQLDNFKLGGVSIIHQFQETDEYLADNMKLDEQVK